VERVEVVRGPSSVLYGSDALGGAINIIRREGEYSAAGVVNRGRLLAKFGSADLSGLLRAENTTSGRNFVFGLNVSGQNVNNLRAGGGRYSHSAESRFVTNDLSGTKGRQAPTGFRQYGVEASLRLKLANDQHLSLVYQRNEQLDVPRFDQIAGGNGNLLYSFDPQRRDLTYISYRRQRLGALGFTRVTASYQSQPETRKIQSLSSGRPGNYTLDWSDTDTLGFSGESAIQRGRHSIAFGGEFTSDWVDAENVVTNFTTGAVERVRGRFPRNSRYTASGVFVNDRYQLTRSINLLAGARASRFSAQAPDIGVASFLEAQNLVSNIALPNRLDFKTSDLTGNAGIVWNPTRSLHFGFNVGRAFRAPNLNDLSGVGLTLVRFEIPSPNLKPETLVGYEFSTRLALSRLQVSISLFDSEIRDLIERRPGSINGQTMLGNIPVLERTNFGRARILGTEGSANLRLSISTAIWSTFTHSAGRNISSGDYLGFEGGDPPTQGWIGLKWEPAGKRYWMETYTQYSLAQDRVSGIPLAMGGRFNGATPTGDALDARMGAYRSQSMITSYREFHRIPLSGGTTVDGKRIVPISEIANTLMFRETPGFATLNFRGGLWLSESSRLYAIVENALDKNYRAHGSGVDAPGFNLTLSYDIRF
jgi:outer membrane receptor protein involved in Fe transport